MSSAAQQRPSRLSWRSNPPSAHRRRQPGGRKLASGGMNSRCTRHRASSRRKSQNAPGLRPPVRRSRVGQLFHRWYAPGITKYRRPDPLARGGDPHPYLYAQANPLGLIDPLGLVSWRCTVLEASAGKMFGGGGFGVVCDSECVDGVRAVGQYLIIGGGMIIGITIPVELGRWDLEDYTSVPDAKNLEGPFGIGSCSMTVGFGFSVAQVFQGKGEGNWSVAPSAGLGIGCFALSGRSFLIDETTACCSE